jgi:hypothetical protein
MTKRENQHPSIDNTIFGIIKKCQDHEIYTQWSDFLNVELYCVDQCQG